MGTENPSSWIQESKEGNLESTDKAVEIARKAKADLDRLSGEIESTFPTPDSLNTPKIEIKKQTEITQKGLLAILAENSPQLKQAFAKNPQLARYAYGHMFSEMENVGLDANALPVIPEKPIEMVLVNGVLSINMPSIQEADGTWRYKGAQFDLFPWKRKEEGVIPEVEDPSLYDHPAFKARPGLTLDEFEGRTSKPVNEVNTYTPEENRERVPVFMDQMSELEKKMTEWVQTSESMGQKMKRGRIDNAEAQTYLDRRDELLTQLIGLELERDALSESRGLEYGSLDQVNQRLQTVRDQYQSTNELATQAWEQVNLTEESNEDPNFKEYLQGLKMERDKAYAELLKHITEVTGFPTNALPNMQEMLDRRGKVSLFVHSRIEKDTVSVTTYPEFTYPGPGNTDKKALVGMQQSTYRLDSFNLKYADQPIKAAREAKILAETEFMKNYNVNKLAAQVERLMEDQV